jgi:hypothetical protein
MLAGRNLALNLCKVVRTIDYRNVEFGKRAMTKHLASCLAKIAEQESSENRGKVRLLARNLAPEFFCRCGKPATQLDTDVFDEDCFYCDKCSRQNKELEETLLPVVNSPRMGICGYCG